MPSSIIASALVAAIVGFGSTLALIVAAATAVGASQAQTASWVTAICLAKVCETGWLSWRYKMPIITAWSTAAAALLGASSGFSINEAVGAFLVAAAMLVVTGLVRPLTRLVARIPPAVASGMLAGILIGFVISAVKTIPGDPWLMVPLVAFFLIARIFHPALSALGVLIVGALLASLLGRIDTLPTPELSTLVFVAPEFTFGAVAGLAVPIYLVTMASQNLPGLTVLRASGYEPPAGPIIAVTGLFSGISAFFGAHTTNLAAITAVICTGPDAHPDPAKRWMTGPIYSAAYLVFAIFGASLVAIFAVLPAALIALVAGLALAAPLASGLALAMSDDKGRFAAVATLAVTASGLSVFGIGSAFWGLAAGILVHMLDRIKDK